ncbi:Mob1/phocein [Gaertneriomyces semiglobifer]|nr:Mob1/phocein [Gaertneriomyces semiglobifer]
MDYRRFLANYEPKTFKAKKQFFQGSKRDQLQRYIVKTLGGGSLREAVQIPPDTTKEEWLAVNTVDFYNQINLLYGCVSEWCTRETCPTMNAGARYEYLWADGKAFPKPVKCSAPEYIEHLLEWVDAQLDDESVFPQTDAFPPHFMDAVRQIFKRLFRFYAHIYHNHLQQLQSVHEDRHLNTCFKHFLLFVTEFDLIDAKELQPLTSIVSQILEQNPKIGDSMET